MKAFAEILRGLRKEHNLTQAALAEAIGANQKAISDYELDTYEPSQEVLIKLSRFFNVTVGYLLGEEKI